jgi:hypothetical protein
LLCGEVLAELKPDIARLGEEKSAFHSAEPELLTVPRSSLRLLFSPKLYAVTNFQDDPPYALFSMGTASRLWLSIYLLSFPKKISLLG